MKTTNVIDKNINFPELFYLKKGTRHNLHPALSFLDEMDCDVMYNKKLKCIFIHYDFDEEQNDYRKGLYTSNFKTVTECLKEYVK